VDTLTTVVYERDSGVIMVNPPYILASSSYLCQHCHSTTIERNQITMRKSCFVLSEAYKNCKGEMLDLTNHSTDHWNNHSTVTRGDMIYYVASKSRQFTFLAYKTINSSNVAMYR